MKDKQPKSSAGVTLIEVMAATVILTITVLGASGYRYYSALDARKAAKQNSGARIALLLCENWRGRGTDRTATYDPTAHLGSDMKITASSHGPAVPEGFMLLGRYEIGVNGTRYWATLSWRDEAGLPGLRTLNVVVAWAQGRQDSTDAGTPVMDKTFKLTTYMSD